MWGEKSRYSTSVLTEAVLVCLLGGVIGVLLGAFISSLMTIGDTSAVLTWPPVLLAFSAAFLTGVFFGFWPAWKASQLDPVVALSSE